MNDERDRPLDGRVEDRLDALLAGVKRDVPPSKDLWASIEGQLEPRAASAPAGRGTWLYALAAGVAAVALTAVVTWELATRPTMPVAANGTQAILVPGANGEGRGATGTPKAAGEGPMLAAAFDAPQDARYRATRAALEKTFRERLDLLAPATRERIEQNLAIIRGANDDIRAALATDPNSPLLQQLLESTWQQEIDLYSTVNTNTEPALPRSET
jgi:hypothetical protein